MAKPRKRRRLRSSCNTEREIKELFTTTKQSEAVARVGDRLSEMVATLLCNSADAGAFAADVYRIVAFAWDRNREAHGYENHDHPVERQTSGRLIVGIVKANVCDGTTTQPVE